MFLNILFHLILKATSWNRYYYYHFTEEKTEAPSPGPGVITELGLELGTARSQSLVPLSPLCSPLYFLA